MTKGIDHLRYFIGTTPALRSTHPHHRMSARLTTCAAAVAANSSSCAAAASRSILGGMRRGQVTASSSMFFLCDVQERFRAIIHNSETVIAKASFLNESLHILKVPTVITEHYPKAMGRTVDDITKHDNAQIFEKKLFSMLTEEVQAQIPSSDTDIIICGIEAHVCVLQTVLDLRAANHRVFVVCDATSSSRAYDRALALQRMKDAGAIMTTTESLLFELMQSADHPNFKEISGKLKEHNANHPDNLFAGNTAL